MSLIPAHLRLAGALRDTLREGYTGKLLRADLLAGLVVGLVAIPLSMALAIACGMPPQHGLATAIVAGGSIALLGGSRLQVSGPTAAFVVVLAPVVKAHGPGGLLLATLMAAPKRIFSRPRLLDTVFIGADSDGTIDIYVHYLRRKLGKKVVRTVHGSGYRFGRE